MGLEKGCCERSVRKRARTTDGGELTARDRKNVSIRSNEMKKQQRCIGLPNKKHRVAYLSKPMQKYPAPIICTLAAHLNIQLVILQKSGDDSNSMFEKLYTTNTLK